MKVAADNIRNNEILNSELNEIFGLLTLSRPFPLPNLKYVT